jgi:hypothetical protein
MMKFILAARRKPQDTQERYFYEWGIIHVALMITTPSVMRSFKRYAQHYSVPGVLSDSLIYPLSPMAWDNMADHWVEDLESLVLPFKSADYCERMQPHSFGDSNFALELTSTHPIYEAPGFKSGGIKLVHFLKRRAEVSQEEFVKRWRTEYAPVLVKQMQRLGVLRKYQHNPQLTLNAEIFKGTLFERGGVGLYGGIEEIWLKSLHDLAVLRNDADAYSEIRAAASKIVAAEGTFSMVTTERVIYDYSVAGKESPLPAVLRSGTLEGLIDAQGYRSWNIPGA